MSNLLFITWFSSYCVGELKGLSGMLDVFPQKNGRIVATLMLGWSGSATNTPG